MNLATQDRLTHHWPFLSMCSRDASWLLLVPVNQHSRKLLVVSDFRILVDAEIGYIQTTPAKR